MSPFTVNFFRCFLRSCKSGHHLDELRKNRPGNITLKLKGENFKTEMAQLASWDRILCSFNMWNLLPLIGRSGKTTTIFKWLKATKWTKWLHLLMPGPAASQNTLSRSQFSRGIFGLDDSRGSEVSLRLSMLHDSSDRKSPLWGRDS